MGQEVFARQENHLKGERSLYLRQHSRNPVDWYPWGVDAFEKAVAEDKPIFLSIGYSACHWCHVMARDSFEDEEAASLLNRSFISIKVDREERPEIDGIYMAACQLMTGSGGWPLTMITTPDLRPFFAGTFIPKRGVGTSGGLIDILNAVDSQWKSSRRRMLDNAEEATKALFEFAERSRVGTVSEELADTARDQLNSAFDDEHGGFEIAPKFPSPHRILFLLEQYRRTGEDRCLSIATRTLTSMRNSGLYDHVGFGFHRYSTDARWHLPHFEKMLYDQAMQLMAYSRAFSVTSDPAFKQTAEEIRAYVLRDLTSPEGAFYSAEGADSDGEEGRFYVWTLDEVTSALEAMDLEVFCSAFDITKDGNFREEASGRRTGRNVLDMKKGPAKLASELGQSENEIANSLSNSLARLFDVRERRTRPDRDDKILADWNGLMIAALASAGGLLGSKEMIDEAAKAEALVEKRMVIGDRLMHRSAGEEVGVEGLLDDYAALALGQLELHRSTSDPHYLDLASRLAHSMITHFWDESNGGFFQAADDAQFLIVRSKEAYDGAIPSGNSLAAMVFALLAEMKKEPSAKKWGLDTVAAFAEDVNANPAAHCFMISAYERLRALPF